MIIYMFFNIRCTPKCQLRLKHKNDDGTLVNELVCRYGFPFSAQSETSIDEKQGIVTYKREVGAEFVNKYNKSIVAMMQSNTDISIIAQGSSFQLARYLIASYISKNEPTINIITPIKKVYNNIYKYFT